MRGRLLRLWGSLPIPFRTRLWMVRLGVRKFPVGVTAAISDEAGRLLMFRHTYRGRYPWGLPSGWLEPGEQPEKAILREIFEETRLEAVEARLLLVHSAAHTRHLDLVYRVTLSGGSFRPSPEVTEMRWFAPDELPEMNSFQYDMIRQIALALRDRP